MDKIYDGCAMGYLDGSHVILKKDKKLSYSNRPLLLERSAWRN